MRGKRQITRWMEKEESLCSIGTMLVLLGSMEGNLREIRSILINGMKDDLCFRDSSLRFQRSFK